MTIGAEVAIGTSVVPRSRAILMYMYSASHQLEKGQLPVFGRRVISLASTCAIMNEHLCTTQFRSAFVLNLDSRYSSLHS